MTRHLILLALLFTACPAPEPEPSDAGPVDAGPVDAGPTDGGHDAGPVTCDDATYDSILGTAQLGANFQIIDSAILPVTSWLPVAVNDEALPEGGVGRGVYGYAGDGRVYRLGTWPNLSAPDAGNLQFDAVSTEDRALQVMTNPQLVTTRGQLLAGYRTFRDRSFVDGGLSIFDTTRPDAGTQWLAAPGIEGALGLGSFFLVGSHGLGSAGGGPGVYGFSLDDATPQPKLVARYPMSAIEDVRPGLMAVSANGIVVLGHYLDLTSRHSLRLPEPAQLAAALSGGPVIDLSTTPELTSADDVANLTSVGAGVAVLHTRKAIGILPALGRLEYYPLTRAGGDGGTLVGAPMTMLSADDQGCTAVSQLVPVAGGLTVIVGLWDRQGQRLVRLAPR